MSGALGKGIVHVGLDTPWYKHRDCGDARQSIPRPLFANSLGARGAKLEISTSLAKPMP